MAAGAVAVAAAFTAFHALTYWAGLRLLGAPGQMERALGMAAVHAVAYLLGAAWLVWLARRVPLTRKGWPLVVAVNLLAVLAAVVLYVGLRMATWDLTTSGGPIPVYTVFLVSLRTMFPIYTLFLCAGHASVYFARDRDAEVRRNRLRAELANARLEATQLQLQPELLFSAFRTLAALMRTDVAAADRLLLQVAALLRATLQRVGAPLVPLRDEAAALEVFLDVARVTGTPAPPVALRLPAEVAPALVPPLVLQGLVGVAALLRGDGAQDAPVRISASWSAAYLELAASTPSPPVPAPDAEAEAELERLRGHLAEIYGGEMALSLARHGARAELLLRIPLLTTLPSAPAAVAAAAGGTAAPSAV